MSKINKRFNGPRSYDEDGVKQQTVKDIKREKDKKKRKNFDNALRSRNIDLLSGYEDD